VADLGAPVTKELRHVGRRGAPVFTVPEVEKSDAHGHDVVVDEN
jgi:hypothetical protein